MSVPGATTSSTPTDGVPPLRATSAELTPRERLIMAHLSQDITLEEIAAILWVSRNTVKSQVRSAYRKIGVTSRADAVAWAEAAGLRRHYGA